MGIDSQQGQETETIQEIQAQHISDDEETLATIANADTNSEMENTSPTFFQVLNPLETSAISFSEDDIASNSVLFEDATAMHGLSTDMGTESLPDDEESIRAYNEAYTQLPNLTSAGIYQEILPDIDLTYLVSSHTVEEYIILHSVSAASQCLSGRIWNRDNHGFSGEVAKWVRNFLVYLRCGRQHHRHIQGCQ